MNKEPLTEKELSEMAGKPVYCLDLECYGIISCDPVGRWANIPFLIGVWYDDDNSCGVHFDYNIQERGLKCYKVVD